MLNGILAVGTAGLYAEESKSGNPGTFMDLVEAVEPRVVGIALRT